MEPRSSPENVFQLNSAKGHRPVRVMIVDDSLTVRTVFSRMIGNDPLLEVATTASNAERAIAILREKPVDVILLDLEMPGMGGLEALPKILETRAGAQVLVVSSFTDEGAEHTLAALAMGAADTMLKPQGGGFDEAYRATLLAKIHALGGLGSDLVDTATGKGQTRAKPQQRKQPEVLAIGGSTGAIHALNILLRRLPREFALPVLITQHLPDSFIPVFARQVEIASARPVSIGKTGTEIRRGEIVIAPGDGHLLVRRERDRLIADISKSTVRSGCLPSVDPMLTSLAESLDGHALAVILSGMGRDGVYGAADLATAGGAILAQDQQSSAVWGMPGAVVKAGIAKGAYTPDELVAQILDQCGAPAWR